MKDKLKGNIINEFLGLNSIKQIKMVLKVSAIKNFLMLCLIQI